MSPTLSTNRISTDHILPCSSRLEEIPEDQPSLQFGNEVYRVKFDTRDPTPRFGHRYTFFLQDAVEEVPEYVVYPEQFEA